MGVGILAMFVLLYYLGKIATLSLKDISRQVHPKTDGISQNSNQP
jgi:hypothetical protein